MSTPETTTPSRGLSSFREYFTFRENLRGIFVREDERFAPVDGVRAITILNVVLFHCLFGFTKLYDEFQVLQFIENMPSYIDWVWQVRGSDCLFLVSGFLMGITLIREYQRSEKIQIMRFYRRRVMRIYPLFLVALAIFTLTDFERNVQFLWSNLLFLTNFSVEQRNIIPVGWSLAVQMQFYLIAPFIVIAVFKSQHRLLMFGLIFVLACAVRYLLVFTNPELHDTSQYAYYLDTATSRLQADLLYYNLHSRFGPFALGLIVAYIGLNWKNQILEFTERQPWINVIGLLLGFGLMYWASYIAIHDPTDPYYDGLSELRNLNYIASNKNLFVAGFAVVVFFTVYASQKLNPVRWFMSRKFWFPITQMILPIYFFHFIFIVLAVVLMFGTTNEADIPVVTQWHLWGVFSMAVAMTFVFSIIFHVVVEQPFIKMRG